MPKRFTDTDIWKKPWFRALPPAEKTAWKYITDQCDNVGVWDADRELAEFMIGEPIDWEGFRERCNGNIEVMENGKWWLVDFCDFQHPDINEQSTSNAVRSYVTLLKKHGLWEGFVKGSVRVHEGSWEKEREREQEQERSAGRSEKRGVHPTLNVPMGETRYANLCKEWGASVVDRYIQKVIDWTNAKDEVTKDYAARAATFITRDAEAGKLTKPLRDDGPMTFAEARALDE